MRGNSDSATARGVNSPERYNAWYSAMERYLPGRSSGKLGSVSDVGKEMDWPSLRGMTIGYGLLLATVRPSRIQTYIPTLRICIKMLEITKTIEASIGPKKLLQQWKLRHAIF